MFVAALHRVTLINLRELRTHWGRALASVGVVAVSAALLVAVLGIAGSITGSVQRLSASIGGDADLEISGITDAGFDQSLLPDVAGVTGVEAAVPMMRMQIGAGTGRLLLLGVDGHIQSLHSELQAAITSQLQSQSDVLTVPDAVIVGNGVGVGIGDRLDLGAGTVTAISVISGRPAQRLNGGDFVIAPLPLAQQVSGRTGRLDSIMLIATPGTDVARLRSGIENAVAGRAIVAAPSFRAAQASGSMLIMEAMTLTAASVSLVVSAFLVYNAMSIAIAQRRPALSTLRALGGKKRMILRDILFEAAILGALGGVIGSLAGIVIGRFVIGRLPSTLVQSLEARIEYVPPVWAVPAAMLACVLASVAASALAARQVYRITPVEALAPVGATSSSDVSPLSVRVLAGVVGVGLIAATVVLVTGDLGSSALAAIALVFIGSCALCFAFSGPIIAAAATIARLFGGSGVIGATTMLRSPRRVWVALMTVLTAVVTTVAVTGADSNAVDSTIASFSSVADVDVWVSATSADVYPTAPLLPPDTEAIVRAVPGVAATVPGQMAFATIGETRVMLMGIAPGSHRDIYSSMSKPDRDALDAGDGVALSRDLGHSMGVSAGDVITLQTPTGPRDVRVLELVPFFSGMTGTVALSLSSMQQWFGRPGASALEVTVSPGADPDRVREAVAKAVAPQVFVYTGQDALAGVSSALSQITVIIAAIAWIVVVVSAVALLNTLMLSVLDRRRELGVLRAIGSTRGFALKTVFAEAAGIGLAGGVLGLAIGAAIQWLITAALTNVLSLDVHYSASPTVVLIALGAVVSCLLGSVPPAVRAARLNIVRAISV